MNLLIINSQGALRFFSKNLGGIVIPNMYNNNINKNFDNVKSGLTLQGNMNTLNIRQCNNNTNCLKGNNNAARITVNTLHLHDNCIAKN